jgi:uncharacterized membrane protein
VKKFSARFLSDMNIFSITINIAASPERVWSVMTDFEHWPEWTPTVKSIKRLDTGPITNKSSVLLRQPKLPPALWKVVEFNPGKNYAWVTVSPGVRITANHSVAPIETGSRVTLSIQYEGIFGKLLGKFLTSLNNRYLNLEANGLKKRSENNSYVFTP